MKYKTFYALFIFFSSYSLFAQNIDFEVSLSHPADEYSAEKTHKLEFVVENKSDFTIFFNEILVLSDEEYIASDIVMADRIDKGGTAIISINLNVPHNIKHNFTAFIKAFANDQHFYIPLIEELKMMYDNEYYDATYNLYGEELKKRLTFILSAAREYTYKEARNYIWRFDAVDNVIEGVYTGNTVEVTFPPNFGELDQNGFNTEHTWPRAEGSDDEPELSDMFHIYPTDKNANAKRGNYAFGYVTQNVIWEEGDSKLGFNDEFGERFEPRDVHKGNVARSMFYFALRYANKFNNFNFLAKQERDLREWMNLDSVDNKESLRNDSIFKYQENRNPFIDYPQFLERINSISGDGDFEDVYDFTLINNEMKFTFENENPKTLSIPFYIYNSGNREIIIEEINQITKNVFPVEFDINLPESIAPGKTISIPVEIPNSEENYAEFEVIDNLGNKSSLTIEVNKTVGVNDIPDNQNISYNYPNPFEEETTISINSAYSDDISVVISDILGNTINISDDFEFRNGEIQFTFNPENLSGKTFYYNVYQSGKKISNGYMLQK